jgi:hypothetical protein
LQPRIALVPTVDRPSERRRKRHHGAARRAFSLPSAASWLLQP